MTPLLLLVLAQSVDVETFDRLALDYQASYVGSEQCGVCHEDLFTQQQSHHMARTGRPARDDDSLFTFPSDGAPPPTADDVSALLGSGVHGVTPIRAEPGRTIREHPMSYSVVLGSWFRTPGTETTDHPLGRLNTVEESRECLGCHATTISWRDDRLDASASVFGVQCERCHGPGSAHIDGVAAGESADAKIFNPRALSRDAQVLFCAQCHRQPVDFAPLEVLGRQKMLARHAGAGLMMSACFREAARERTMTCTTCHSPHRNTAASDHEIYRQTCLGCHAAPETVHVYERVTATSDCTGCHMPPESEGFYGMTFTDHWIRVPGARPPLATERLRDDLNYLEVLYRNEWERDGIGEERRARLALGLAEVSFGLERRGAAFEWLEESLSHAPAMQGRLKAAAMYREGGDLERARAVLRHAVALEPDLLRGHFDLGEIAAESGSFEQATTHYQRALEIRSDFAEGHAALGAALRRLSRLTEALEHLREADRLEPNQPMVIDGIAWVLATHPDPTMRDVAEAVRLAERAAAATGYNNPLVLDTLGAAYAANGDFETARNAVHKAIGMANAAGVDELVSELQSRLELYEAETPYVSPRR